LGGKVKNLDRRVEEVEKFWFEEIDSSAWWVKSAEFDAKIKERFGDLHKIATERGLEEVRTSAEKRLAEVIILDQFSRNIYRDRPESFAFDGLALSLAQEAVAIGDDRKLNEEKRLFFYMPYMHSESLEIHDQALKLFESLGREGNLKFEHAHRDIIVRFGRYPHRNQILGRESTPEEIEFLKGPGSSF
jgi:uncharacterized protein (DUF924 family)